QALTLTQDIHKDQIILDTVREALPELLEGIQNNGEISKEKNGKIQVINHIKSEKYVIITLYFFD
ncbi:MAG: hypothetical protein UH071_06405, partial [Paludibacteraceae bacterium]|nr:hypothetical protein [Paludibacteraceae bacterium]